MLLGAEAPPRALDRYFYFEDVTEQDAPFRYVATRVPGEKPTRDNQPQFLARLRDRGFFLIDLKVDPVNGSPLAESVESGHPMPRASAARDHPNEGHGVRRGLLASEEGQA